MTRSSPASKESPGLAGLRGLPEGDPVAFLDAFSGEPRGFWGRGERWVAWGGELTRIEVPPGGAASRFDVVRREARSALGRLERSEPSLWKSPRFFGGFSFIDVGTPKREWNGFAPACFILPRVTLTSRYGEVRHHAAEPVAGGPPASVADVADESTGETGRPGGGDTGTGDRSRWRDAIRRTLSAIEDGRVQKVVLARIQDARFDNPVDPLAVLRSLRADNARAHVFLFEPHPGRVFVGAAPEILAQLRGGQFEATAVAGSMPRAADPGRDEELARRLLGSEKNRTEHHLTVDEMVEVLEPRLIGMEVDPEPRVLRLAGIQHLETVIRGGAGPGEDILSLVEAVHPTPAVCGRPREEALRILRGEEPFDRGWYSGPVGWFDGEGEGDFVPALRSAVGAGREWRLFAGAGIVSGSDPDAEWDEIELKLEPALRALRTGAGAPLS